jgi:mannose-6-phosphate isomerase-like protein (cupin superfamily)
MKGGITIKIANLKEFENKKNPHNVDSRVIYSTDKAMVVHILLKPGESLKRHITPVEVAFYILEGKGTIEIGDEKAEAGPDTIIESPARVPHRWINNGPGVLRVLVMKLPRPTENTIVL